ncbi:MAG TPA: ferredoxin [Thermoclostridium sp.]
MKAFVDKDVCIGCGLCADLCPEVFNIDDDGTASAIDTDIPEDAEDAAKEAAAQCPVEAIKIDED